MDDTQGVFVPYEDNDYVDLIFGPQGGAMIGVALLVRGSSLPGCMQHSLEAFVPRTGIGATTEYPVATYPSADGTRITRPIWLVFDGEPPQEGDEVELVLRLWSFEVRPNTKPETAAKADKPKIFAPQRYNAAINASKAGNHDEAIKLFTEITTTNPDFANAYTNLGLLYWQKANKKEAEQAFRKALSLNSKDAVGL